MEKFGILCAVDKELAPFLQDISDMKTIKIAMLTFHQGIINNIPVVAVYSGVGKVNAAIATQILIDKFQIDYLIVSGIAGGMAKGINVFDTVVCTEVICHDTNNDIYTKDHLCMKEPKFYANKELITYAKRAKNNVPQTVHFGLTTTGEIFVNLKNTEALCIEMETSAVAHTCYVNNIPFIAIRSISDNKHENGEDVINKNFDRASYNSYVLTKAILEIYHLNNIL